MNIAQRSIYFLIGLLFGCFIVYFIAKQKNIQFPYGPNARTLRSILKKKYHLYADAVLEKMQKSGIDSLKMAQIIAQSEVDFSKSKTATQVPCQEYFLESYFQDEHYILIISRCDSTATVTKFILKK